MKGVVNLHGAIIPAADLRLLLDCDTVDCDDATLIVVLSLGGQVIGPVADSVSDFIPQRVDIIKRPPSNGPS